MKSIDDTPSGVALGI